MLFYFIGITDFINLTKSYKIGLLRSKTCR
jgi:hypothetical protein